MKLERLLQSQGFGSRRECRSLIRNAQVRVEDREVSDPFAEIAVQEGLVFQVAEQTWHYRERLTLLLHKPVGYECSHAPRHHPSVYGLLPLPLLRRGLECIGRLDVDTSGLILLTDDGQLNHRLASGKKGIAKHYRLRTQDPISAQQTQQLLQGVQLKDEERPLSALSCQQLGEYELELAITEGKYHQVRRMLGALGHRIVALHRFRFGEHCLPADLAPGAWREIHS